MNYQQIPVNRPKSPVHSYSKDDAMRVRNVSDPVYAPNSLGGPKADPVRGAETGLYAAGAIGGVVSDEIRERAFQYWKNIDKEIGDRIERAVRNGG